MKSNRKTNRSTVDPKNIPGPMAVAMRAAIPFERLDEILLHCLRAERETPGGRRVPDNAIRRAAARTILEFRVPPAPDDPWPSAELIRAMPMDAGAIAIVRAVIALS